MQQQDSVLQYYSSVVIYIRIITNVTEQRSSGDATATASPASPFMAW